MVIGDIVVGNNRLFPNKVGIVDEHSRLTWKEVNTRANRLANALLSSGLTKGDKVAIICENCTQYAEFLFAVAKAGLIGVCLNYRLAPNKLAFIMDDCQPNVMFVQDKFRPLMNQIAPDIRRMPDLKVIGKDGDYEPLLASAHSGEPEIEVAEQDTYLILYTTGTTGMPKGIELTQKNWVNNCVVRLWLNRYAFDDVYLLTGALFAAGNLAHFLDNAYAGITSAIPPFSGKNFVEMVEREKVTASYLNPTSYRIVRDYIEASQRQHDLTSLRNLAIGGGQPSSAEQVREILDYFHIPHTNSSKAYGMAEVCSPATFLLPSDVAAGLSPGATGEERRRLDSVGKPLGNTEMRVVDEDDNDVAPEQKGEILLRGDGVMNGYWNKPEVNEKALRGGWYHSGDLGILDQGGYLYFAGRQDFLLKSGGFFVAPEEVENAILRHPAIAEAAVIGIPDEKWGEVVKAVVRLKPGTTASEDDIREHCRKHLARYEVPKSVDFVQELPRESAYGKISREELLKIYIEGREPNLQP
jgi:acyl-CoA synthetase (AMP-forming)/AMP-acid ligase II